MAPYGTTRDLDERASRWLQQARTYRRAVELYHDAVRTTAAVRAQTRGPRLEPSPAPAATPPPVLVPRPAVAYRSVESRVVADPVLPLSDREIEVARLVARGCSNDELARELVITPGTAANHVARIMRKLGVRSRTGIGVWAVERGVTSEAV